MKFVIICFFYLLENFNNKKLCSLTLKLEDVEALRLAIEEFYYFEFVLDDIPIRGFVGQVEETNLFPHKHHIFLYTHHHFDFYTNNNQVIEFKQLFSTDLIMNCLDCLC